MGYFHPLLERKWREYTEELKSRGSVLLPPGLVFSSEEVVRLDAIQSCIPEETVSNGDADDGHYIFVRRIITDKVGQLPTVVNGPHSSDILSILEQEKRRKIFAELFGWNSEYFIRRCQVHRLVAGAYIGLHLDAESDPDNEYSMMLQLGRDFEGGEFIVYESDDEKQVFLPTYGTVLVTTCQFRHEVKKVLANERRSLVCFYSRHEGANRRDAAARCSRPGCRWCGEHLRSSVEG